jgi:hypothetical protein
MSTNIGEAWEESVLASRGGAIIRIEFNTNELCFLKLFAEDSAIAYLTLFHFT